jgi:hypothetical protein
VAAHRLFDGDFDRPVELGLAIFETGTTGDGAVPPVADLGDLNPTAWAWTPTRLL